MLAPISAPDYHRQYTVEEYFALEEVSDVRHEYYKGEIFPLDNPRMAGGTKRHNLLIQNCAFGLRSQLRPAGSPCEVFTENVRVAVEEDAYFTYPDVVVTCDERDADPRTAQFPSLIFEILSDSTEARDRGWKLERYRRIPSLAQYVVIAQTWCAVDSYTRAADGDWSLRFLRELTDELVIPVLDLRLPLATIYERIKLSPLRIWRNDGGAE